MPLAALAVAVLALAAACSSAEPTPVPPTPTAEPTATATPEPDQPASEGGEPAGAQGGMSGVTDPTDISQFPVEYRELATCIKETLGDVRFEQMIRQIIGGFYAPLIIDFPIVGVCDVTMQQLQDVPALFGMEQEKASLRSA
jgi:hypothetical protein